MFRLVIVLLGVLFLLACNKTKEVVIIHPEGYYKEVFHVVDDSIMHGEYIKYYPNGIVADSSHYVQNKIHGKRRIYTPEAWLEIEESYDHGIFNGPYKTFYRNGQIKKEQHYINNKIQGNVTEYYESGGTKAIVKFVDNLENGAFREYYENGKIHWEGFYQGGEYEQDTLKEYNKEYVLIRKLFCEKGICQTVWTPERGNIERSTLFEEH